MKTLFVTLMASVVLISTVQAQSLKPGLWKAKTDFKLNGIPLPESDDEECITKAEAADAKTTITKALKKQGCTLSQWKMKKNQLEAALVCKNKEVDAKGKIKGTFSFDKYELKGEADGTYQNVLPSSATIKLNGHWVKECAS